MTRKRDRYRALRLHVGGTPLQLTKLRVIFADGSSYASMGVYEFTNGSWTHHVSLPLPAREGTG